jgi:hypothetical protein
VILAAAEGTQLTVKQREAQAREMQEEEEMSEEEMQKMLEKEEFQKMRRTVHQAKQTGEIERYNSLKQKEKTDDDRIEEQMLDLNTNLSENCNSSKHRQEKVQGKLTSNMKFTRVNFITFVMKLFRL